MTNKQLSILFKKAEATATVFERPYIDPDVLFDAALCSNNLGVMTIFDKLGFNLIDLTVSSKQIISKKKKSKSPSVSLNKDARKIVQIAKESSEENVVGILYGCLNTEKKPQLIKEILEVVSLETINSLIEAFFMDEFLDVDIFSGQEGTSEEELMNLLTEFNGKKELLDPFSNDEILSSFGENLNLKAKEGHFDNLIAFDDVIQDLTTVMCRQKKPNAILVGPAGGGKTSNVELLAKQIVSGEAPELLLDKVIYTVNLAEMVAGTTYRGQFEERLKDFIAKAKQCENLILFIDEIHTLVGAGGTKENDLDASNMLKPALARGDISCIGATTLTEYNKTIKRDSALDRRFERIVVKPPSSFKMEEVIPNLVSFYEKYHNTKYSREFVKEIIPFCEKYMPNRFYPDKAVDVIDHCGAMAKVDFWKMDPKTKELAKEIEEMSTVEDIDLDVFTEKTLRLDQEMNSWGEKVLGEEKAEVGIDILREFFNKRANFLSQKGVNKKLKEYLKVKVLGQEKAVDLFAQKLNDVSFGLQAFNPNKSPSIFCVHGMLKTGRSYFCSSIADFVKKEGGEVLEFNGIEFDHISKVISSQPDGNSLAQKVSISGNSVVVIDDFDKINGAQCNTAFRQIFKEGRIRLSDGEICDFSNVIFVISTPSSKAKNLGFGSDQDSDTKANLQEEIHEYVFCQIQLTAWSNESLQQICENSLKRISLNLKEKGFNYKIPKGLSEKIADEASSKNDKVKAIEALIQKEVCEKISFRLTEGKCPRQ